MKIDLTNKVMTSSDALHDIINDQTINLPEAMGVQIPKRGGKNVAVNFLNDAKDLSTTVDSSTIKQIMLVMNKLYWFEDFYSRAVEIWKSFSMTNLIVADTDNDEFNKVVAYWLENVNASMSIASAGEDELKKLVFTEWLNLGNSFPYETWSMTAVGGKRYKLPMKIMCLNPQNIEIDEIKAQYGIEEIGLSVPYGFINRDGRTNKEIMPIKRGLPRSRINKLKIDYKTGNTIIPIDKRLIIHLKRNGNHHNPWGVPFGTKAMNSFADLHRKREMDFSVIEGVIRRILLFKIGTDEYPASQARINQFLNLLANPQSTFTIAATHDVTHEDISPNTDILDYEKKYEHEIVRILVSLGVPPVLLGIKGSTDPEIEVSAFAESLREPQQVIARYFEIIMQKIISQNPQFAGIKPRVTMSRANINISAYMTTMRDIYYTGNMSHKTYLESIDIDYEQEKKRKTEERSDGTDELFVPPKQPFQGDKDGTEEKPKKTNTQTNDNRDDKKEKRKKMRKSFGVIFDCINNMDDIILGFNGLEEKLQGLCKFHDKFYDKQKVEQLRDIYTEDSFCDNKDIFKSQLFELVVGESLE